MKKINIKKLHIMKQENKKITALTAYDFSFAKLLSDAEIDIILVGDSLGNVIQGHKNTIPVTVADICYHTKIVSKGTTSPMIIADMPFQSYATLDKALENASALMQSGAEMVKIEGGKWTASIVSELATRGIPICGHLGLTPQYIHKIGSYSVQGREEEIAKDIITDALNLEQAGADLLVLECVPTSLAAKITSQLEIPTIGIGAGKFTDGQVLVTHDILGLSQLTPKFTKNFMSNSDSIEKAIELFKESVRSGEFPDEKSSFE
ncbi:3-methyl-2-oxobutanoate hydroxymethyltransferase [Gammaproteobacteria bacterium]|nr:3-methyl-2-oxobutanoate hydroxymethyltransferase [Gammaproteobacteria bacterium]